MATDPDAPVALTDLDVEEKAKRSGSFGAVASSYERYRPGPPLVAVEWYLPERVGHVVDLGAGTGALTRLLMDRADRVSAVEPDDRMREVLVDHLPGVDALKGTGEQLPLEDGTVNAILASSSWHWMDVERALREARRVLVPGGILGTLWSGPDRDGAFVAQTRALLSRGGGEGGGLSSMMKDADRPDSALEIPPGFGFAPPEKESFGWSMALTTEDIIGLLGTLSWAINLDEAGRQALFDQARDLLEHVLGGPSDATIDIDFRCNAWRTVRQD